MKTSSGTLGLFDHVDTRSDGGVASAGPQTERLVDISDWLRALRDAGWSVERIAKNELPVDLIGESYYSYTYDEFWNTLTEVARAAVTIGLDPLFIKSMREYRYYDSNVDLVVPANAWKRTISHLSSLHWKVPAGRDRLEQSVVEKRKLKLPSTAPGILPAHMYGGVSWGYQRDISLLLRDPQGRPDPAQVRPVALRDGGELLHPDGAAELVVQAAHIVYENFRMTLGEAAHVALLVERHPNVMEPARALAATVGCTTALDLVVAESRAILEGLAELAPERFPLPLPKERVKKAFAERWTHLRKNGSSGQAVVEWTTSRGFLILRGVVRAVRRRRRGHEDRR